MTGRATPDRVLWRCDDCGQVWRETDGVVLDAAGNRTDICSECGGHIYAVPATPNEDTRS